MQPTVAINTEELDRRIAEFARVAKRDLAAVMRNEARLLFATAARFTPPTGSGASHRSVGTTEARRQGERRTVKDLNKAVAPLRPWEWTSKRIQRLINERKYDRLTLAFRHMPGRFRGYTVVAGSQVPSIHYRYRDRRGRVNSRKYWATPDYEDWDDYRDALVRNVGRAKAGWWPALRHLGGKAPAWVKRHGSKTGEYRDTLGAKGDGYVGGYNISEWANRGDEGRVLAEAVRSRARSMEAKIHYALNRKTARFFR